MTISKVRIASLVLAMAFAAAFSMNAGASSLTINLSGVGGGTATLSGGTSTGTILDATSAPTTVGTGVIDSFDRVQNNGTEQGYDTNASGVDDNKAGGFTHIITIASLDTGTHPGYVTFLLDINQTSQNGNILSVDDIKLFTGTNSALATTPLPSGAGVTKIWDLQDATSCSAQSPAGSCSAIAGTNHIILNYNNNEGSGNGFDMFLEVPISVFNGISPGTYLYLYSSFGAVNGDSANDGFEEWAQFNAVGQTGAPEPGTLVMFGSGLIGIAGILRRRYAK